MSIPAKPFGFTVSHTPEAARAAELISALRDAKTPRGAELRGRDKGKDGIELYLAPSTLMRSIAGPARRAESLRAQEALSRLFPRMQFPSRGGGLDVHAVLRTLASYQAPDNAAPVSSTEPGLARVTSRDGLFDDGDKVFEFSQIGTGAHPRLVSSDKKDIFSVDDDADRLEFPVSRSTSWLGRPDTDADDGTDTDIDTDRDSDADAPRDSKSSVSRRSSSPGSELTDAGEAQADRETKGSSGVPAKAGPQTAAGRQALRADLFEGSKAVASGGKTGSKCRTVKIGDVSVSFQVKTRVSAFRAKYKGGRHAENFAEVIASKVARAVNRALTGASSGSPVKPQLVPDGNLVADVSLVIDEKSFNTRVASRYLSGEPTPTLDSYAATNGFQKNKASDHVRLLLATPDPQKASGGLPPDVMPLSDLARKDILRNIALSALVNDHDVNPGNMVVVDGQALPSARVARIDFGHAFGDLTSASQAFGGQQRDPNTVRDFFNRESVAGLSPGGTRSKLWRDYIGLLPSKEFADVLREVAGTQVFASGLKEAWDQFDELAKTLAEGTSATRKERAAETAEVLRSLAGLCKKVGGEDVNFAGASVDQALSTTFGLLTTFLDTQCRDMREVADQCELQALIDESIFTPPQGDAAWKLEARISALCKDVGLGGEKKITWLRVGADHTAHVGSLESYIQHRRMIGNDPLGQLAGRAQGSSSSYSGDPLQALRMAGAVAANFSRIV